jgi:hypothetical protein
MYENRLIRYYLVNACNTLSTNIRDDVYNLNSNSFRVFFNYFRSKDGNNTNLLSIRLRINYEPI